MHANVIFKDYLNNIITLHKRIEEALEKVDENEYTLEEVKESYRIFIRTVTNNFINDEGVDRNIMICFQDKLLEIVDDADGFDIPDLNTVIKNDLEYTLTVGKEKLLDDYQQQQHSMTDKQREQLQQQIKQYQQLQQRQQILEEQQNFQQQQHLKYQQKFTEDPGMTQDKIRIGEQQQFLQLMKPPMSIKKEEKPLTIEEKIKEEAQWQVTAKKDKDIRLQQLEEKLASLTTRIPKGQGQFPKTYMPRISGRYAARSRLIEKILENKLNSSPKKMEEFSTNSPLKKMEELIKADPKLKEKLERFIAKNRAGQFYISSLKKSIYISRRNLDKLKKLLEEKQGGFLPLIPILAGIAAAGSVAGGAAGIASAVNKKKAEDAALAEQYRHNISLEDAARGKGLKEDVVKFVENNELDDDVKRIVKKTLKGLASVIPMRKEGGSLILSPYRKDGGSLILNWK